MVSIRSPALASRSRYVYFIHLVRVPTNAGNDVGAPSPAPASTHHCIPRPSTHAPVYWPTATAFCFGLSGEPLAGRLPTPPPPLSFPLPSMLRLIGASSLCDRSFCGGLVGPLIVAFPPPVSNSSSSRLTPDKPEVLLVLLFDPLFEPDPCEDGST